MKTPEEIKSALKICMGDNWHCYQCPYNNYLIDDRCDIPLYTDALALIQRLEERIELMKIQMQGDCGVCKHWNGEKCDECLKNTGRPHWEYEGLPK